MVHGGQGLWLTGGDDQLGQVVGPECALLGAYCSADDLARISLVQQARVELHVFVTGRGV